MLMDNLMAQSIPEVQEFRALSVTQNSITVGFEANSGYSTQITCHPDCDDNVIINGAGNRTYNGLDAGKLYTFVATHADEFERKSEPVTVNQDTIPPPPENLQLSTFEILEVEIKFFGVKVPHRVETSGVLAEWQEPNHGNCDCYDAMLDPDEGIAIEPRNQDGELDEGQQSRQFIHLVPGKEYDIEVWGKTCGNGQISSLESPHLAEKIVIPPEGPGKTRLSSRDSNSIKVCFGGPSEGYFTGFDFVYMGSDGHTGTDYLKVNDDDDTYNYRNDQRQYCHTVDGLNSCTKYIFEIYTTHNGARSKDKSVYRVETLPAQPTGLKMLNYDSDSVELSWDKNVDAAGYMLNVQPDGYNVTVAGNSYRMDGLSPGQRNEFEVQSYCILTGERRGQPVEYKLYSKKAVSTQATLPEPPSSVTASCKVGASSVDMNRADETHFNAALNQEIVMSLDWEVPATGHWDGFVVTYSPFIAMPENSEFMPPFSYGAGRTAARINLPRTDQKYTVYVRSTSDNIESEAAQITVTCGEPTTGPKQCNAKQPEANLIQLGRNMQEIPLDHLAYDDNLFGNLFGADDPMTPQIEFRGGNGHTSKTVVIRSDNINCDAIACDSLKLNFNVCTAGFGCEERFVAAACPCSGGVRFPPNKNKLLPDDIMRPRGGPHRPISPSRVVGDSCCGDVSYSSADKACCHNVLYDRDGEENCCGAQKYNKKEFKCCGGDNGWGLATLEGSCEEDKLMLPQGQQSWMDI